MRRPLITFSPGHEEGIMFLARRMVRRDVQRVEIVPIGFDLRPLGDGEAHIGGKWR